MAVTPVKMYNEVIFHILIPNCANGGNNKGMKDKITKSHILNFRWNKLSADPGSV